MKIAKYNSFDPEILEYFEDEIANYCDVDEKLIYLERYRNLRLHHKYILSYIFYNNHKGYLKELANDLGCSYCYIKELVKQIKKYVREGIVVNGIV